MRAAYAKLARKRFWNDDILRDIRGACDHIVTTAGLTAKDAASRAASMHIREHHP